MEVDKVQEIFSNPVEDVGTMRTLSILSKHVNAQLLMDEQYNLYYEASLEDILKSNITEAELLEVRQGGWKLDIENNCLIKNF